MIVILKSASFKCRQAGPGSVGRMPYLVARRRAGELVGSSTGSCSASSGKTHRHLSPADPGSVNAIFVIDFFFHFFFLRFFFEQGFPYHVHKIVTVCSCWKTHWCL